ncbi:MAG: hypothetical protein KKF77_03570 [Proteobacteria bacterium]|nr:hypothetical protein [Pseudomonadota bacterium]
MKLFRVQMELDIVVAAEDEAQAMRDAPDFAQEAHHEIDVLGAEEVKRRRDLPSGYSPHAFAYTTAGKDIVIDSLLED